MDDPDLRQSGVNISEVRNFTRGFFTLWIGAKTSELQTTPYCGRKILSGPIQWHSLRSRDRSSQQRYKIPSNQRECLARVTSRFTENYKLNKRCGLGYNNSPSREKGHETTNTHEGYYVSIPMEGVWLTPHRFNVCLFQSQDKLNSGLPE